LTLSQVDLSIVMLRGRDVEVDMCLGIVVSSVREANVDVGGLRLVLFRSVVMEEEEEVS
jgi:hypothetical protein